MREPIEMEEILGQVKYNRKERAHYALTDDEYLERVDHLEFTIRHSLDDEHMIILAWRLIGHVLTEWRRTVWLASLLEDAEAKLGEWITS